ncbi:hypothetical protein HAHE_13660 [Haloferula helveola]|uniref:Uncharacterized protein n=1 Tax=Haloferula helveola TaxID=490095 RepID=A0ABM7RKD8_9BACT|nr:hypothetical protein HAHE_13660 [Haloferula helveola]
MSPNSLRFAAAAFGLQSILLAVPEQVGDLRISNNSHSNTDVHFDPAIGPFDTRNVAGAPLQLNSLFTASSQVPTSGGPGDPSTDLGVQTNPASIEFRNLNRFASSTDGGLTGAGRLGAFQYEIDLSPVEDYLTGPGSTDTLNALTLDLVFSLSDTGKAYDVYLSYTEAGESITETSISTDSELNYDNFYWPSQSAAEGDVVNGTHKILKLGTTGNLSESTNILGLYNAGVRKLLVSVMMPSFFSGRTLTVESGSGISIGTDDLGSEQIGHFLVRDDLYPTLYYADQHGPVAATAVAGASIDVPSVLLAVSQNPGGNPDGIFPTGSYSFDSNNSGTNSFNGNGATVTGYGANGIGATASDEFEFTAWQDTGNFSVDVKLASLTSLEAAAQAGLMVRGSQALDSAHVFLGVRPGGEPVVVSRDADGNVASETVGAPGGTPPQWLRITRTGDLFEFFISGDGVTYAPASPASATVVMTDPVYVGFACTSGSATNDAVAVFEESSVTMPDKGTDIGLRTYTSVTRIKTLNRFASTSEAGFMQWEMDLTDLDSYLATNTLNLDLLELRLKLDMSDEAKPFDVYISYTDPTVPIVRTGIVPDNATVNYTDFVDPAIGATPGDVVGGTHRVLVAQTNGDIDLTENLLALYQAGIREFTLMVTTPSFYSGRFVSVLDGAGLFIETSPGASAPILVTNVAINGGNLEVTVDGLTNGQTYHLEGSDTLLGFAAIPGTEIVATGSADVLSVAVTPGVDPKFFVQVVEGSIP